MVSAGMLLEQHKKEEQTAFLHLAACPASNLLLVSFIKLLLVLTRTKKLIEHKKINSILEVY